MCATCCNCLRSQPSARSSPAMRGGDRRGRGGRGNGKRSGVAGHGRGENVARCRAKRALWGGGGGVVANSHRRREREKKKWMMPGCEHAHGRLAPNQNRDSGIVSLRMAFNPGKVRRGFLGASIEGAHWTGGGGQVPKVPRFARFGFASLEENSVASTLRAAASIAKSPQGRDDFQQEMTGGAHCFPGARQNIAAHVSGVHLLVLGRARRLSMFGLRSGCWLFDERSRH